MSTSSMPKRKKKKKNIFNICSSYVRVCCLNAIIQIYFQCCFFCIKLSKCRCCFKNRKIIQKKETREQKVNNTNTNISESRERIKVKKGNFRKIKENVFLN
jgi:hypothetical protein